MDIWGTKVIQIQIDYTLLKIHENTQQPKVSVANTKTCYWFKVGSDILISAVDIQLATGNVEFFFSECWYKFPPLYVWHII